MRVSSALVRKGIVPAAVLGIGIAGLAAGPAANAAMAATIRPASVAASAIPQVVAWQYGGRYPTYLACSAEGIISVHGSADSPFDDWRCEAVINDGTVVYYNLFLHVRGA